MSFDEINNIDSVPSASELYDKIIKKLLEIGSMHLYTNKPSTIIPLHKIGKAVSDFDHNWRIKEYRFGKAIMITRVCDFCYFGDVEVISPQENRKVIEQ